MGVRTQHWRQERYFNPDIDVNEKDRTSAGGGLGSHLHFVQAIDPLRGGGLGTGVSELHRAMRSLGAESTLLSTSVSEEILIDDGVVLAARSGPDRLFYSRDLAPFARQFISAETMVHGHGFYVYPNLVVPAIARQRRRPLIYHPHGMLEPWARNRSRSAKAVAGVLFENRNVRDAALWRALTVAEADQIRDLGVTAPIIVVPNGVDSSVYRPGVSDSMPPTMLFLGRLHPKKGLGMLLDAWHRAEPQNQGWRLIIAGPDEADLVPSLQRSLDERGISSVVEFVGEVRGERKLDLMRSASAFVLPSFSEGFPIAALEAMACGLPVILTHQCNIPDIEMRQAGILCDATTEDLTRAVRSITELDQRSLSTLGANGRAWVESDFTWPAVASVLLEACAAHF